MPLLHILVMPSVLTQHRSHVFVLPLSHVNEVYALSAGL